MFKKRALLAATAFLIVVTAGVAYCLFWPPVYEATCLVVVQPQKVPGDIVKATVTTKIQERLHIITQQVLSRSRLTEIIDRFDLYPDLRTKVTPDQLADKMRQDITIKITTKQNYFTVNFLYTDPNIVAGVTNALAAFYVDSNLRLREEDAVGTARFLKRELERMGGQLREWETRIRSYKQEHIEELPESRDQNLLLMQQIRNRLSHVERLIQSERFRHQYIDSEIGALEWRKKKAEMEMARLRRIGATGGGGDYGGDEATPAGIKAQINTLLLRYQPDHPDVLRLKQRLASIEAADKASRERRAQMLKAGAKPGDLPPEQVSQSRAEISAINLTIERMGKQLAEIERNLEAFAREREEQVKLMDAVQQRLDNAPRVAEELLTITRGYQELKEAYEKMHARALEANMAANLERTQRGEQFEVIDPAEVPLEPSRPNVKRSLPVALALGLALAIGLTVGLSYLDTSFTSVEQMEREGNLPVLVVIPPLQTTEDIATASKRKSVLGIIYGAAFLVLFILVGILLSGRGPALKRFVTGWFA